MRLEPLYRITFTTPEAWQVGVEGANGTERQSFLIAEGRSQGRLSARYRGATSPVRAPTAPSCPTSAVSSKPTMAQPSCSPGTATRCHAPGRSSNSSAT